MGCNGVRLFVFIDQATLSFGSHCCSYPNSALGFFDQLHFPRPGHISFAGSNWSLRSNVLSDRIRLIYIVKIYYIIIVHYDVSVHYVSLWFIMQCVMNSINILINSYDIDITLYICTFVQREPLLQRWAFSPGCSPPTNQCDLLCAPHRRELCILHSCVPHVLLLKGSNCNAWATPYRTGRSFVAGGLVRIDQVQARSLCLECILWPKYHPTQELQRKKLKPPDLFAHKVTSIDIVRRKFLQVPTHEPMATMNLSLFWVWS